jgi:hypothetical protein
MTLNQFVTLNGIKQADAIILRKKILGMVDHYALFLGYRNSTPVFVANYRDGVKEVSPSEMSQLLEVYQPNQIEQFKGTELERKAAVNRALSRVGERAYNYISNNCEHFKQWVHTGEHRSDQVKTAAHISVGLGAAVGVAALANKSAKGTGIALGLLLLGAILHKAAED